MGTPLYMSPEQHGQAEDVDGKADVFSLGVVLYELLTGAEPYPGNSLSLLKGPPKAVGKINPWVPAVLQTLVARMMALAPADRPTMDEVARVVEPLVPGGQRAARPWWLGWAAGAGVVVGVLLGILAWRALRPRSLAEARERALVVVREAVVADATPTRVRALRALGQSRDYGLRALVEPLLTDEEATVTAAAAAALGQLGDPTAQPALLTALQRVRDADTRLEIAASLVQLHNPHGASTLHELCEHGDEASRLTAALALADHGDLAGLPPLRQYLDRGVGGDGPTGRVLAALARLGDEDARERLGGMVRTAPSPALQVQAAWSLARLGEEAARAQLTTVAGRGGPEQVLAARLLASLGEPSVYDLLITVAGDDKKPDAARELAFEGLGDCARSEAVPTLLGAIEARGASVRLRLAAAGAVLQLAAGEPAQLAERSLSWARTALGSDMGLDRELAVAVLGDSESDTAVAALGQALKDRDRAVRRGAVRALGRKPSRAALAALTGALEDNDVPVRTAAAQLIVPMVTALRKGGDEEALRTTKQRLDELTRSSDEVNRMLASAALLQLGDRSQSGRLRGGLGSADAQVRRLVVEALDPASDDAAALVGALKDATDGVRLAAARRLAVTGNAAATAVLRDLAGRSDGIGIQAFAALRKLGQEVSFPVHLGELGAASLEDRSTLVEAAAELPAADALRILQASSVDAAATVRRRASELLAALVRRSPSTAPMDLLRVLQRDPNLAVRARASELLRQLPPKLLTTTRVPPAPGSTPGQETRDPSRDKSGGFVLLQGEDGVRIQLDRGAAQLLSSRPVPLTVGKHRLSYLGGGQDVVIAPGNTVTVRVPVSLLEQIVADAAEAVRLKEFARAQTLLDRARRTLLRGGAKPTVQAELTYQQGRLDETRGKQLEAMSAYGRYLKLPDAYQKADSRAQARAGLARLSPHFGLIQIFTLRDGQCKLTDEYYLAPGEHLISLGGGRSRTVTAQRGVVTPVRQCP